MIPIVSRVVALEFSCLPEDHIDRHSFTVRVEHRGKERWAVTRLGDCLSTDGSWDYESLPSNRREEWLTEHRFTLERAMELAEQVAPKLTVNGHTVEEVLKPR